MMEQVARRITELEVGAARDEADEKSRAEWKKQLKISSGPYSNQVGHGRRHGGRVA